MRSMRLLGKGDSNTKLAKSERSGKGYITYGLSLAPADSSGYNICPGSSAGCRAACLFYQGRARVWKRINEARIRKTKWFYEDRAGFIAQLRKELHAALKRADRLGMSLAVRLNVLSDIPWEHYIDMQGEFSRIQFYDYTKILKRLGKTPPNYHLTFSRSEENGRQVAKALAKGYNVTFVFNGPLPEKWAKRPVYDGDQTDLRFLDPAGVIVGLKAKGTARKDTSGFVVASPLVVLA